MTRKRLENGQEAQRGCALTALSSSAAPVLACVTGLLPPKQDQRPVPPGAPALRSTHRLHAGKQPPPAGSALRDQAEPELRQLSGLLHAAADPTVSLENVPEDLSACS